jgi:hypothetical protein
MLASVTLIRALGRWLGRTPRCHGYRLGHAHKPEPGT